jgi:hypothetical protein
MRPYAWSRDGVLGKTSVALLGLLVFAFAFGFKAYLAPYGIDPHHDGIMFKPALDVSQGKMVFRDTFTQYGGLTVLLQAAALKLFGAKLLVLKLHTAFMYGAGFFLFWRAWSRLMPPILAALACAIGTAMGPDSIASSLPWSSVNAFVFQGLALLCCIRYLERGRERELFFAGIAGAMAFWCRQPVGVFLTGGLFVALVLIAPRITPPYEREIRWYSLRGLLGESPLARMARAILLFGGGAAFFTGLFLLWLARYGALEHWWKQSILYAQHWSKTTGGGEPTLENILPYLFPGGHLRVWALMATAVAIQAARSTAPFLDPKNPVKSREVAMALLASTVALTSWPQNYPVACNYHCYWAGLPMFGVFAYLFYSSHEGLSRWARSLVAVAVMGIVFYYDVNLRIEAVEPHMAGQNNPIRGVPALSGMRAPKADQVNYEALQVLIDAYLRAHPDGTIVTTTGHGLFPTLIERQAVYHPIYMYWGGVNGFSVIYADADAARQRYIAEHAPLIIGPMEVPPTHVYVGHLTYQGVGYNILVPKDVRPAEILECNAGGGCRHTPFVPPEH